MTNIRECRICLSDSNDEESLIQPCRCNTAYVHESCLQKWRIENIDNEKYEQCEICKTEYIVQQEHPRETFELYIKIRSRPTFCLYSMHIFIGALFLSFMDTMLNQTSLAILNFGTPNPNFVEEFNDGAVPWFIYYLNYSSFIFCMFFFLFTFIGILFNVHRKKEYIKNTGIKFGILFLLGWNYFFNYYIFYIYLKRLELYMAASIISVPVNFFIMKQYAQIHDHAIRELNTSNVETIISVKYNPLIEITTVED